MGLAPGAWLRSLKDALRENRPDRLIALPHGGKRRAGSLAADLILTEAPKRLVYATDFADTAGNRRQLISLAQNAHTLFCEASFREADRVQAHRTGHLTGRACGEIATDAEVARLVPFHFSRRYEDNPGSVYAEVADACARVCVPEVFQER
jgi:ribonuclease BN (tRNA processing enzyme)